MTCIPKWKLITLFIYSCIIVPIAIFLFSLIFQWILASGNAIIFWGEEQLYIASKMAIIGIFLGVILWLSYYLPYRKHLRTK